MIQMWPHLLGNLPPRGRPLGPRDAEGAQPPRRSLRGSGAAAANCDRSDRAAQARRERGTTTGSSVVLRNGGFSYYLREEAKAKIDSK